MGFFRKLFRAPALALLSVSIGAAVVLVDRLLFGWFLGRPVDLSEPVALLVNTVLVSVPFIVLALRGSRRLAPWLVGLALTCALWWHALQKGIAYQRAPDGSGVDMGLAFLMLLSPAFIAGACVGLDEALRRRGAASR
jgi:hypothetical protein